MRKTKLEIIGHRGAKGLANENSLKSIKVALKNKVSAIELDVRAQSGKLVLNHDQLGDSKTYLSLDQTLKLINNQTTVILDIKEDIAELVLQATKTRSKNLIYSSKKFKVLQDLYRADSSLNLAVIESWSAIRAVYRSKQIRARRIHFKAAYLWKGVVQFMLNRGFRVYCYTVNKPKTAQKLANWGIQGIFTDYPDRF